MTGLKLASARFRRGLGLAASLTLALGTFVYVPTQAAATTSAKVGYIFSFGAGSNDPVGPPSIPGSSIFRNALTGGSAGGTYTTADNSKTVTITDLPASTVDAGGVAVLKPFDTIIAYQVCDIGTTHLNTLKALNDYLVGGGKVMLFDGDRCAPSGPGVAGQADYSKFLFPFSTSSPGPQGASGSYTKIEPSTLTAGLSTGPQPGDSVGDANIFTSFTADWCASITAKNTLGANGFVEAYARTPGGGFIVYEGEDFWFTFGPTSHLRLVFDLMLKQSFNPDGLPCSAPASGIKLAPPSQTHAAGDTATVTASVTDVNGNPKPGITVTFAVTSGPNKGLTGTGVTDASGNASFSYSSTKPGTDTLGASFVDNLNNTHTSNTVTVTWTPGPPAKLVLTPKTATNTVGNPHTVTATVTDSFSNPTPAVAVKFTVTGANPAAGAGVTDTNGRTPFTYTGTKTGNDTITAQAVGGSNPSDTASKTWKAGTPASLVLTPKTAVNQVGTTHTVTATVRDKFGNPVPGATVDFTVSGANTASGTATTDANGQARFSYKGTNTGFDAITAQAREGTRPGDKATKLWFAFAQGGSFVIGDGNAKVGNQVEFWGAQWAKTNQLSGGPAPRSFKGFENSVASPTCGTKWTTNPGNSSGPPDTIPAFMGVIVSSKIDKSGSTISGDTVHIVVVKTDPGYAPNPGHAGSGRVIAIVC